VAQAYSMQGFDITVDDGILEMRTEGKRTSATGPDAGRTFENFLRSSSVRAVIFDVRGADYAMNDREWEERARTVARVCRDYLVAIIDREDQSRHSARVLELHESMGGRGRPFRSRAQARAWLRQELAQA
jgi:hypothetical protein